MYGGPYLENHDSRAVCHDALPSRLGALSPLGIIPRGRRGGGGGPEVDPRHHFRRPAAGQPSRRSLPVVETGTCCNACYCKQLKTTTINDRNVRCGITHMYSTVRNRTEQDPHSGRAVSDRPVGQGQDGRETSLGSVRACHAPDQLSSERRSPGGSCHLGRKLSSSTLRQRCRQSKTMG